MRITRKFILVISSLLLLIVVAACTIFLRTHHTEKQENSSIKKENCNCVSTFTYKPNMVYGIDVSKYQGNIDWKCLAENERIQFVYIRATYGTNIIDEKIEQNVIGATNNNFSVGLYHFFVLNKDVAEQVNNFNTQFETYQTNLIPVIDVEEASVPRKWIGKKGFEKQVCDSVEKFISLFQASHPEKHLPMIYSAETFFNHFLSKRFADYPKWIANYNEAPTLTNNASYLIWQFSDKKQLCGISTRVDMNIMNTQELLQLLRQ